mmetsp:Transcript_16299/g.25037  ORF Transcript_16299/g.25037 Transcript_16299/m.25037 type:complete len:498 (-) Transcript_16299:160-1653(-)
MMNYSGYPSYHYHHHHQAHSQPAYPYGRNANAPANMQMSIGLNGAYGSNPIANTGTSANQHQGAGASAAQQWIEQKLANTFYMYSCSGISGPYSGEEIFMKYLQGCISSDEIYVRPMRDCACDTQTDLDIDGDGIHGNGDGEKSKWCKVILPTRYSDATQTPPRESTVATQNEALKTDIPELYQFLIPRFQAVEYNHNHKVYEMPVDVPEEACKGWTCAQKTMKVVAQVIGALFGILIALHVLPMFAGCCMCCAICIAAHKCFRHLRDDDETDDRDQQMLLAIFCILMLFGLVLVPCFIVFVLLLGTIDMGGLFDIDVWDGQIQSWQIAYIAWGCLSFLMSAVIIVESLTKSMRHILVQTLRFTFRVTGIEFDIDSDLEILEIMKKDAVDALAFVFLFPSLAALLPASTIGFVANYILEEKFVFECHENVEREDHTLCFDGYGCCEMVSSHDPTSMYVFVGGFASNVLAVWAIIRILGFLLVHITPEASNFAKRQTN